MKQLKKEFLVIIFIIFLCNNIYSAFTELYIKNWSSNAISVKVYPVGCVFNGDKDYKLWAKKQNIGNFHFIFGSQTSSILQTNEAIGFEHDAQGGDEEPPEIVKGVIGYGKY